ncbi:ABC transporter substrate-binding protein [Georgenia sp. SYP-B2076]|uniref:ABC transporter substrate-binding protein n=1 Tax=Georgenia sp. SYP-B2076 TaxID=2495881 RepID=UPI000F8D4D62|nr:extracellular solute-binding protein [Georgenia sp. SYP-B2076]
MAVRRALVPAAATMLLLAGCATGGGTSPTEPVTVGADGALEGEITVWTWDVAAVALERLAATFEKENPGTSVEVVDVGYDNAYDKLSVGLQAGSGLPDIVTIEVDRAPGYLAEFPDGFVDLGPVLGDKQADFDPFKWSTGTTADGTIAVAPWDSGTVGMFYRADYLAAAGVDPSSIETWADLVEAGEQVKTATGNTLMSVDVASGAIFRMMLHQQGQGYFDENGDIAITSPEAVEALTLLQDINARGLLQNVRGWDGRVGATKDGSSAFHPEAVWWTGTLTGEMPELSGKFSVMELPAFEQGGARTANNGGSGLAVPTQAENPELAAAFIDFALAGTESQVSMMENEGLFPAYLPALEDEYFQQELEYFGGQPVFQLFAEQTKQIPTITYATDDALANDTAANAVVAAVINGEDPAAALQAAAEQIATATGREIAG